VKEVYNETTDIDYTRLRGHKLSIFARLRPKAMIAPNKNEKVKNYF